MSQVATDTNYSPSEFEQPSEAVVRAVADAEGLDPTAIDVALYEVVDPDALDDLLSNGGPTARRPSRFASPTAATRSTSSATGR